MILMRSTYAFSGLLHLFYFQYFTSNQLKKKPLNYCKYFSSFFLYDTIFFCKSKYCSSSMSEGMLRFHYKMQKHISSLIFNF